MYVHVFYSAGFLELCNIDFTNAAVITKKCSPSRPPLSRPGSWSRPPSPPRQAQLSVRAALQVLLGHQYGQPLRERVHIYLEYMMLTSFPDGSNTSTALAPISATTQCPEVGLTATETGSFNSRWLKLLTSSPSRLSSANCLRSESINKCKPKISDKLRSGNKNVRPCPPICNNQTCPSPSEAEPSHTSPSKHLCIDVCDELQLGRENLDPAVASVGHVHPLVSSNGHTTRL